MLDIEHNRYSAANWAGWCSNRREPWKERVECTSLSMLGGMSGRLGCGWFGVACSGLLGSVDTEG
ncbi:hypothetical protein ACWEGE_31395 [Amycolatopsis sp. NPDC004747]